MTEITNYKCDICGAIYAESADAEKCEAFHIGLSKFSGAVYNSVFKTNIPYPGLLLLEMADGAVAKYAFNELITVQPQEDQPEEEPDTPVTPEPEPTGDDEPEPEPEPIEGNEGDGE